MYEGAGRTRDVHECRKVRPGLDGHTHERRFAHRQAQPVDKIAQAARIIRRHDHRAAAGAGARSITVSIGYLGAPLELERGLFLKEGHHAWCGIEEGTHLGFVEVVAKHVAKVMARCLRVFE